MPPNSIATIIPKAMLTMIPAATIILTKGDCSIGLPFNLFKIMTVEKPPAYTACLNPNTTKHIPPARAPIIIPI